MFKKRRYLKNTIVAVLCMMLMLGVSTPWSAYAEESMGTQPSADQTEAEAVDSSEAVESTVPSASEQQAEQTKAAADSKVTEPSAEKQEEPVKETQRALTSEPRTMNLLGASGALGAAPLSAGPPAGTAEEREPWYPTTSSQDNDWQIVDGKFFDGQKGASTQKSYDNGNVILRKNVLPTKDENIFNVALKIRAKASYSDVLDATAIRVQNGGSSQSSKVDYFMLHPTGPESQPVWVYFMNAPDTTPANSLPGSYKVVYKKQYYVNPDISGQMFLYYDNELFDMDHGGQKQKVTAGVSYYVPIGTTMTKYDQLYHAAVPRSVTDVMGENIKFIDVLYKTDVPGVSGRTSVSGTNTLTWKIDDDGIYPVGEDYKLVKDTVNGKTVYYREYDLEYRVHLDASESDFVPGKVYPTNENATLKYTYDPRPEPGDSDYQDYDHGEKFAEFPKPSVKGTLYNLSFIKIDEKTGEPLEGADFKLAGDYGVTKLGISANRSNYTLSKTSGKDGVVTFEDLPWGDYTLSETAAPLGYDITFTPKTCRLCYTTNPNDLDKTGAEYYYKKSLLGTNGKISNRPWPESEVTISKQVDNYDKVLLDSDKDLKFPIKMSVNGGYDTSKLVIYDENKKFIPPADINTFLNNGLKHGESLKFIVRLKQNTLPLNVTEDLSSVERFEYVDTGVTTSQGTKATISKTETGGTVTIYQSSKNSIIVTNHYIPQVRDVNVLKKDAYDKGLSDAQFSIYTSVQKLAPAGAETITRDGKTYYKLQTITTGSSGLITFKELDYLLDPQYIIVEDKTHDGYFVLGSDISFHFDKDHKIALDSQNEDVSIYQDAADKTDGIKVINHLFYKMPSAGGIGTYIFTFLGTLLIAYAVMTIWRRKVKSM